MPRKFRSRLRKRRRFGRRRSRGSHLLMRGGLFHKRAVRSVDYTFRTKVELGSNSDGSGPFMNSVAFGQVVAAPSTGDVTNLSYYCETNQSGMFRFDWTRQLSQQLPVVCNFQSIFIKKSVFGLRRLDTQTGNTLIFSNYSDMTGNAPPIAAVDRQAKFYIHYLWLGDTESTLTKIGYSYITEHPRSKRVELRPGHRISWKFYPQAFQNYHHQTMNRVLAAGSSPVVETDNNFDMIFPGKYRRLRWIPVRMLFKEITGEGLGSNAPWMASGGWDSSGYMRLVSRTLLIAVEIPNFQSWTGITTAMVTGPDGEAPASFQAQQYSRIILQPDQFCQVRLRTLQQLPYNYCDFIQPVLPYQSGSAGGSSTTERVKRGQTLTYATPNSGTNPASGPNGSLIDLTEQQDQIGTVPTLPTF